MYALFKLDNYGTVFLLQSSIVPIICPCNTFGDSANELPAARPMNDKPVPRDDVIVLNADPNIVDVRPKSPADVPDPSLDFIFKRRNVSNVIASLSVYGIGRPMIRLLFIFKFPVIFYVPLRNTTVVRSDFIFNLS